MTINKYFTVNVVEPKRKKEIEKERKTIEMIKMILCAMIDRC